MRVVRKFVQALLTTLLLLIAITACPLLACPLNADSNASGKACCHKSHSHPPSCPQRSVQNCPYLMLEMAKVSPTVSFAALLPVIDFSIANEKPHIDWSHHPAEPIQDSSGLYLKVRVLRV